MKKMYFLLCFSFAGHLLCGQDLIPVLEIQTTDLKQNDFIELGKNSTEYIRYVSENVEIKKIFRIKVLASVTGESVAIIKAPGSTVYRETILPATDAMPEKVFDVTLAKDEGIEYQVIVKNSVGTFTIAISLSTEKGFAPNANFIFLSAIRSVAGKPQTNEFFDLNLKFNYLKQWFTLFSLDLSLSPADSGQVRINEGFITVNCFVENGENLKNGSLKRAFFFGSGLKVFNQQPYIGIHGGSLEINGPLFSSYALIGYYRDAYGRYAVSPSDDPINFRNNIYSEFTLAFDNKKNIANILSDIRVKLGMMFPFTNSKSDLIKPLWKDTQYRLVLEVPIGGIYKF